jgi:hypothetical protein
VDDQSGVFTVPCRAAPHRTAPRRLLHNVEVNSCRQRCHGDDSTVLSYYVTVRCWAIRKLFTGRPVQRLYNDSSVQNSSTVQNKGSTVQCELASSVLRVKLMFLSERSDIQVSETSETAGRSEQVSSE